MAEIWKHQSFTPPLTTTGKAALLPTPPWYYSAWALNVGFSYDATRASTFVPEGLGRVTGNGCVHFVYWQATATSDDLLDPTMSQFRETSFMLEVEQPDGEIYNYCPAMWVNQDASLVRGILQGLPKKTGNTWLTQSFPIAHPAASPLAAGTKIGGVLSARDRVVFEAQAVLTGEKSEALGYTARPTIGAIGMPDMRNPGSLPVPRFTRADTRDFVYSEWHEADAALTVHPHPYEEVDSLGELAVTRSNVGYFGFTLHGVIDV
ncbi:acetoacetate decarboxylase family protein [Rhodococcus sp. F64268]|uniref:acetoacetate decarboxylase family protein n=1 Tax=Rhodococcus sp. F64268 TaxID=2926402 RepID=UPI001FF3065A|nr:acetoacetate decarboxylase family protein [Rhodococcus sp. F64268]MCK0089244.1 acetoacetate decarboxylase family protein [Rhodococcus sp. F64268]